MEKFDTTVVQKQRDHKQRRRGGELNPTSYEYVTCNTHRMRENYTLLFQNYVLTTGARIQGFY